MAKADLNKLLELATLAELNTFVKQYAKTDNEFSKKLTNYLSDIYLDKEEGASEAIERLEDAFSATNNIGDRWHDFEVTDWNEIVRTGNDVLKDARRLAEMGNAQAALSIALRMFELGIKEDLNYVDEMDEGDISDLFDNYGKLIVEALSNDSVSQNEKNNAINFIREIVKSELNNYGYIDADGLLRDALVVSQSDEERLNLIDKIIKETTRDYELVKYVRDKIDLLCKMNKTDDARDTVKRYLYLPEIRKDEINKKIESNQLDDAFTLAEEGKKLSVKNNHSQNDGLEIEFDICGKMGDTQKQIEISRTLFVSRGGNMEDYCRLKKLVPKPQWSEFLANLLKETNFRHPFGSSIEADIYVAEKDWNNLYHLLMRKDHLTLDMYDSYAHHINDSHAPEIVSNYGDLIKGYATHNMGAKHYMRIRLSMEKLQRCKGGKEDAHRLAVYLRDTYSRRPSLLKEISKF